MIIMKKLSILFVIFMFVVLSGFNIVNSKSLNYESNIFLNNPPQIVKSLTYYDKYNDILYVTARDSDNDKICIGIDWDRDHLIDEWSTYRRIKTRWEFDCDGRTGIVYYVAEDEHGARSQWYESMHKTEEIMINQNFKIFFNFFLRLF